ncbi:hypothetical protein [Krasilnikovia sp. MM14-A1259]|uniref:hypothetical protein n=1 Tax=Krasilnikovia sp. MM14-A1259 TaxID=3373539 RepID=UPI0037F84AE3
MTIGFTPGGVLKVPLAGGRQAYALMLSVFPDIAFYRTEGQQSIGEAMRNSPAFIIGVVRNAYSRGRWGKLVAHVTPDQIPSTPAYFRQSRVNPKECYLVDSSGNATKVAPADCVGYEREAAWAAEHVESRLEDLYAGRPSAVVEATRLII